MKSKMTILCLLLVPTAVMAQQYQARAVVTAVTPIVENIVVSQNCRDVYVQQPQQQQNVGGQILGAVVGGAIGSRFGGGNGRLVATGAGAAIGAVVGGNQQQQPSMQMQHICNPVIEQRQTANAYVANYNGARVTGITYRPLQVGDTIYVNVKSSVTPAE